jgi:MFS family permease
MGSLLEHTSMNRGRADCVLLCVSGFSRSVATGGVGVLIGIYLSRMGLCEGDLSFVVAAGLSGAAAATLLVTLGVRAPRRATLVGLALLSATGCLALVAFSRSGVAVLAGLAFLGMLNGMGRDRGAAMVLESATLPGTVPDDRRTRAFAGYHVLQDTGHAIGALLAGVPEVLRRWTTCGDIASLQIVFGLFGLLNLVPGVLSLFLSRGVEPAATDESVPLSPEGKRVIWRISGLFFVDSLAGGLLTTALLSFFFFERFEVGEGALALLFGSARILNALSHLGAAWLSSRIGLLNTMVFTHIPSSLLLATALVAPSFPVAAALFLLREGLVEMDVPTRQSYVMAVVRPSERVVASGVTHLVRLGGWAAGPSLAGLLMQGTALAVPFLAGAGLKVVYDVLLFAAFRGLKPPEERREPAEGGSQ